MPLGFVKIPAIVGSARRGGWGGPGGGGGGVGGGGGAMYGHSAHQFPTKLIFNCRRIAMSSTVSRGSEAISVGELSRLLPS